MPKKRDHGQGALYYIKPRKLWRGVVDLGVDPQTGKRRQKMVHAKDWKTCKEKLEALQQEIAKHGVPLDRSVTVAAWVPTWLEETVKPNVDPKTYKNYRSSAKWVVAAIGTEKIHSLRPLHVQRVRKAVLAANRSTATARLAYNVTSLMLASAVANGLADRNVAEDVDAPKAAVGAHTRGEVGTEAALAFLRTAAELPDWGGARWWFKMLTGARQGEILGAELAELDLDAGLYTVAWKLEELTREHGCDPADPCKYKRGASCPQARWQVPDGFEKRQIDGRWHWTRPKSEGGERIVPLIPQLVTALRGHVEATAHLPNPHGLIWRNVDGSPITPKDDAQQWRDLLVAAEVIEPAQSVPGGTNLTGHWARHTVVTVLAAAGVDFQVIGEIVGHSSAQVTKIYRHTRAAEKRAAMEAIGTEWAAALTRGNVRALPSQTG